MSAMDWLAAIAAQVTILKFLINRLVVLFGIKKWDF